MIDIPRALGEIIRVEKRVFGGTDVLSVRVFKHNPRSGYFDLPDSKRGLCSARKTMREVALAILRELDSDSSYEEKR